MKKLRTLLMCLLMCGCASDEYQTISASQAKDMMEQEDIVIIDVRRKTSINKDISKMLF